jgi:hypothetical protein
MFGKPGCGYAHALLTVGVVLTVPGVAQTPSESPAPVAIMKQMMLDLIHPASNDLLLFVYRAETGDEKEWAAARRNALSLAEAGNRLMARGYAMDQGDWITDAKLLVDAGTAAYKAAQAKDMKALAALTDSIDRSCTTCHKRYRANVFPREGVSR